VEPLSKNKTIFLYVVSLLLNRSTLSVGTGVVATLHGKEGSDGDFYVQKHSGSWITTTLPSSFFLQFEY
jgi:hypothetical protein